jgi:hypothetical protein
MVASNIVPRLFVDPLKIRENLISTPPPGKHQLVRLWLIHDSADDLGPSCDLPMMQKGFWGRQW